MPSAFLIARFSVHFLGYSLPASLEFVTSSFFSLFYYFWGHSFLATLLTQLLLLSDKALLLETQPYLLLIIILSHYSCSSHCCLTPKPSSHHVQGPVCASLTRINSYILLEVFLKRDRDEPWIWMTDNVQTFLKP